MLLGLWFLTHKSLNRTSEHLHFVLLAEFPFRLLGRRAVGVGFVNEFTVAIAAFGFAVVKRIPDHRMPKRAAPAVAGYAALVDVNHFRVRGFGLAGHLKIPFFPTCRAARASSRFSVTLTSLSLPDLFRQSSVRVIFLDCRDKPGNDSFKWFSNVANFSYHGEMQKFLIIAGIVFIAVGLLWPLLSKLGIGRLPGDILIRREGFTLYFPLTTMIVVSIVLTLIFRFWGGK